MRDYSRPDHWTRKAKAEGYAARSVYKLDEICEQIPVISRGSRVVDLGCTPGSWGRYAAQLAGPGGRLVGVDLNPPEGYPGIYLPGSVEDITAEALRAALDGPADALLSDMAPLTTGDKMGDHLRQIALAEQALALALGVLRPGGAFVVKVFDGSDAPAFSRSVAAHFEKVARKKPKATRPGSVEFFLVATGFRGVDRA